MGKSGVVLLSSPKRRRNRGDDEEEEEEEEEEGEEEEEEEQPQKTLIFQHLAAASSATPARGYTKQQLAPIVGLLRNPAESVARTGPRALLGLGDRSLGHKADSEGQEVVVLAQEVLAECCEPHLGAETRLSLQTL
ncbi:unnamed protein product [Boreogadus saida]